MGSTTLYSSKSDSAHKIYMGIMSCAPHLHYRGNIVSLVLILPFSCKVDCREHMMIQCTLYSFMPAMIICISWSASPVSGPKPGRSKTALSLPT